MVAGSATFELLDRIQRTAIATPARIAYTELRTGRSLGYAALHTKSHALAQIIASQVPPGSTAILRGANRIEFPIWFLAFLSAGIHVCPVIPELTDSELQQLARRTRATAAVNARNLDLAIHWPIDLHIPTSPTEFSNDNPLPWYAGGGRGWGQSPAPNTPPPLFSPVRPSSPKSGVPGEEERPSAGLRVVVAHLAPPPGDLLLASSGTTGEPKIVRRTAASLDAVAAAMVHAIHFTETDHVLASVPLSHSYGLEHGLLAPLWAGSTVHLCEGLDMPVVAAALAEKITVFPAVPAMVEMLATLSDAPAKMPHLRVAYSAGGPLPESINDAFQRRFGQRVGQVYGMTEIGSVTFNDPNSPDFQKSSVGRPMQNVSIRTVDVDRPTSLAKPNHEGEITVRAASMFAGYLGEDADFKHGYFRTGDLGRLDPSGNLHLTGRVRLLINTAGTKVNPIEIEAVLAAHPEVRYCVVVPVRQTETIHRLGAVIVPRNPAAPPTPDSIRHFAKSRLAPFKIPRVIEFRADLPLSSAGKVQRHLVELG
jgi:acyl-CoA synthetase (AMP-forming)/AMP-acid ligase II